MSSPIFLNNPTRCEDCSGINPDCGQCIRNKLKNNFINWTSGNTKIDNFIQEKQLKINHYGDIIFEWIPYDQFNNVEEIDESGFTTAIWKDGPLHHLDHYKWIRISDLNVGLKFSRNSQNNINEFLNKVKELDKKYEHEFNKRIERVPIYGISQDLNTKDYIIVHELNYKYCKACDDIYTGYKCKSCLTNYLETNFTNWTSRNKKIDNFIQEKQLNYNDHTASILFEWIPYNQFNNIKKIGESDVATATWMDGPLLYRYNQRLSNHKVTLKCSNNSQNRIDKFLDKVNDDHYSWGISQNPDTKEYIMIHRDEYCKECGEFNKRKWCESCRQNNFINWTSGNEKIDNFIQEMKLKNISYGFKFEWIPYHQFNDINEIGESEITTAIWKDGLLYYSHYEKEWVRISDLKVTLKFSCQNTIDEFLNKVNKSNDIAGIVGMSQNPNTKDYIVVFKNEYYHQNYCEKCEEQYTDIIYKWCKQCQMNYLKNNFTNWTSGNKQIDNFIQEKQSGVNFHRSLGIVFEWIPYCQFNVTNKISRDESATICLAVWKDGPLSYDSKKKEYIKNANKQIALKCLHNSQSTIDKYINMVLSNCNDIYNNIFGLSQNPDTKEFIIIFENQYCKKCNERYTSIWYKWCRQCQINYLKNNFTSGNEKIDNVIQEKQLEIKLHYDTIFEWIPYSQFSNIKEVNKDRFAITYSAICEDRPYYNYDSDKEEWKIMRKFERVGLKCLYNLRNTEEFLNEVKQKNILNPEGIFINIYGISQNPNTKNYIVVFEGKYCTRCDKLFMNYKSLFSTSFDKLCKSCRIRYLKNQFTKWTSGDKKLDNFIQERQLKINCDDDIIFEWISYNQFNDIKEIGEDKSAIWKDGSLYYNYYKSYFDTYNEYTNNKFTRRSNQKIALRYLYDYDLQKIINEANEYSISNDTLKAYGIIKAYGISQNPGTKDYILVLEYYGCCGKCDKVHDWHRLCHIDYLKKNFTNWTSGNEKIDNFIKKMQLEITDSSIVVFEWIPYNQFKEVGKGDLTIAIWKDGPLCYDTQLNEYKRSSNVKIVLKHLRNSQNIINEVQECYLSTMNNNKILYVYGVSQNPDTNDYVIVLQHMHCDDCETFHEWYGPCYLNYLRANFTNWTSKNEKINNIIQEMQLKIDNPTDIIYEWIPYDQFNDIKEIGRGGFATVYSAIWKDGPLYYTNNKYKRNSNIKVALKCLFNSQNLTDEFLNEVQEYSTKKYSSNILKIYGISQNSDTNDYIIVLEYAEGGNFSDWMKKNYKSYNWLDKMGTLFSIIGGLKEIHQKKLVHHDLHTGNILIKPNVYMKNDAYISDMGLCGKVNLDKTKIFGVMPYVACEVLEGGPYIEAADIYSFGMVMYFAATGRQPFANHDHDEFLAMKIWKGIRPEIDESEAPKCYIDLMKRCWDSDPKNRPHATEIYKLFSIFCRLCAGENMEDISALGTKDYEIKEQFKKAEEFRRSKIALSEENSQYNTLRANYTSKLLNPFVKDLSNHDTDNGNDYNSENEFWPSRDI